MDDDQDYPFNLCFEDLAVGTLHHIAAILFLIYNLSNLESNQ